MQDGIYVGSDLPLNPLRPKPGNWIPIYKVTLCIDLGTKTGWALRWGDSVYSGTMNFKNDRFEGGGRKFVKFVEWLNGIHKTYYQGMGSPMHVFFEEVRARQPSVAADHAYGGFMGHLTAWCEQRNIPYEGIPVGTIKKYITGKGNANKQAVIDAVKKRGYNPKDDNEADALALLMLMLDR